MHKSEITAVFLAAILFTGAMAAALPSFMGDAEASSDQRDKYRNYDDSYDKRSYGYDDNKRSYGYDDNKRSYGYDDNKRSYGYDDKYSSYGQEYYKKPSYGTDRDDRYGNHDNFKKFKLDFYVVTEESDPGTVGDTLEATATCDKNDQVTGGGFEVDADPETTEVDVTSSVPDEDVIVMGMEKREGWTATGIIAEAEPATEEASLTAYAVCFDNQPEHKETSGMGTPTNGMVSGLAVPTNN